MEVNVSVAVRVRPPSPSTDRSREPNVVVPGPYPNVITVNNLGSFQFDHVMPMECNQSQFFGSTVNPLITYLLEGYDVTTIAYGQAGSGKSYTVLGPGPHCALSEMEYGIAPRATREVFNRMRTYPDRKFRVSVSFVEIYQEVLRDLLNPNAVNGNLQIKEDPCLGMVVDGAEHIECQTIAEVFNCLLLGMNNRLHGERAHTIFSLLIEQQIRAVDQPVQHRVSQLMLVDLAGSERLCSEGSVRLDSSLAALGNLIYVLATQQSVLSLQDGSHLPYRDSKLTHMLKSSFGGRSITLFICCVSGAISDVTDTVNTLNCGQLVQAVKNRPTVNMFVSPINTPVYSEIRCRSASASVTDNMFGMEFVMHQWKRLVTDAEGLFHQITEGQGLSVEDLEHIQRWLCLKQECEEIVASQQADSLGQLLHRSLDVIGELSESEEKVIDETDEDVNSSNSIGSSDDSDKDDSDDDKASSRKDGSDSESPVKSYHSNNQSDVETEAKRINTPDFLLTLDNMIEEFKITTDHSVQAMQDYDSRSLPTQYNAAAVVEAEVVVSNAPAQRLVTRRNSICPDTISHRPVCDGLLGGIDEKSSGHFPGNQNLAITEALQNHKSTAELTEHCNTVSRQNQMKHVMLDLQGVTAKISELEVTIQLKEEMLQNLIVNSEVRAAAKQRLERKLRKTQDAYKTCQLKLAHTERLAQQQMSNSPKLLEDLKKYRDAVQTYKQKIQDISSIQHLTEDSAQKVTEMEQSLEASKRQLEKLKRQLRKEEKLKLSVEKELQRELLSSKHSERQKATELSLDKEFGSQQNVEEDGSNESTEKCKTRQSRSSDPLLELSCGIHDTREGALLKKAIRKLRKTKDCLIAQRCEINKKYRLEGTLTTEEERKVLEIEEAIAAIDTAIEFKNEVLCGRTQDLLNSSSERDTGENQLMERLVGLSLNETKMLLYKYFQKVVDLRDSSRKLEIQVVEHETQAELQTWRFQALGHALQQARYAEEQRLVAQQHAHDEQLHLLLRHCAEESGHPGAEGGSSVAIARHGVNLELRKENRVLRRKLEEAQLTIHTTALRRDAHGVHAIAIPEVSLRKLQATGPSTTTRVTREKNKLVIQQHRPEKSPD